MKSRLDFILDLEIVPSHFSISLWIYWERGTNSSKLYCSRFRLLLLEARNIYPESWYQIIIYIKSTRVWVPWETMKVYSTYFRVFVLFIIQKILHSNRLGVFGYSRVVFWCSAFKNNWNNWKFRLEMKPPTIKLYTVLWNFVSKQHIRVLDELSSDTLSFIRELTFQCRYMKK